MSLCLQWATCYEVPQGLQDESKSTPIGEPLSDTQVFLRPMEEAETRKRKAPAAEVDAQSSRAGTADEDLESGVIWLRGLRGRRCQLSGEKEAIWYAGTSCYVTYVILGNAALEILAGGTMASCMWSVGRTAASRCKANGCSPSWATACWRAQWKTSLLLGRQASYMLQGLMYT
jgi:hypothetical protein